MKRGDRGHPANPDGYLVVVWTDSNCDCLTVCDPTGRCDDDRAHDLHVMAPRWSADAVRWLKTSGPERTPAAQDDPLGWYAA